MGPGLKNDFDGLLTVKKLNFMNFHRHIASTNEGLTYSLVKKRKGYCSIHHRIITATVM